MKEMTLTVYGLNIAAILEEVINSANIMANSKLNPNEDESLIKTGDKKLYTSLMKAMGDNIKDTLDCLVLRFEDNYVENPRDMARLVELAGKMLGNKEDCRLLMEKYDIDEAETEKGKMYSFVPIGIALRTLNTLNDIEAEYSRRLKENAEFVTYASAARKLGLITSRVGIQSAVTSAQEYKNVILAYIKEYRTAMERYDEHNEVDFSIYCKLLNRINSIIDMWRETLPTESAQDNSKADAAAR